MKFTISIVLSFLLNITTGLYAQIDVNSVDMIKINALKKSGVLKGNEHFVNFKSEGSAQFKVTDVVPHLATNGCDCWLSRDSSWQIAPMDASGLNGGPGLPPDYRNDDWSTAAITLPFNFCYYGTTVNEVFINNNGNISINTPYSEYDAMPFPNNLYQMIAPFWADVDTRDLTSGLVYYKLTPTSLIIQWEEVGYFEMHGDLQNTFQLIITDGNDSIIPDNGNVAFCYQDMQWTTGDASLGIGGFGGIPATVGINKGNSIEYIQIGQFDQPGIAFDGPFGNNDGIDALDYQYFYYTICSSGNNIAPIVNLPANNCNGFTLDPGDSISFRINFLSPEQNQTTTITYTAPGITSLTALNNTSGNFASLDLKAYWSLADIGVKTIFITATDNAVPPASTVASIDLNFLATANILQNNAPEKELSIIYSGENLFTIYATEFVNATLSIYDLTGKNLIQLPFDSVETINLSSLRNGIYLVEIHNLKGKSIKGKLQKN